jgi:tetratricopeptide (TPR) repeat protein
MTDLASAYFERAEANNRMTDYAAAVELLNRALKASPDDPVMLFNRAVVEERMHLYDLAIQDWQRYLRVDSGSGWTVEAKKRLADVERAKERKQ